MENNREKLLLKWLKILQTKAPNSSNKLKKQLQSELKTVQGCK